jgi:hypothetical protein
VQKDLKRTVTSEKKTFNQTAFETTEKDGFTISSYNKTFGPVNVQDNENILVEAQPKRFKSLERNEMQGQQIEGEPAYKKWNKRNASANPYDATLTSTNKSFDIKGIKPGDKEGITLTSENKTFNISRIRQDDKDEMTITSSHKTFGTVDVDNNGEISVGAEPRRFKNIERGESLSKEIEGEPIYEKWNKSVVNTMPTQETVVSKNKKFDEGEIRPASKDGNTITSHHKTFDPVNVQGSEGISVSGEPRRFKNIERGDSMSKEIEGEPTFRKWNKRINQL